MDLQTVWAKIADLNGTLIALEHGRSAWSEFEAELAQLIEWLWEQEESELRDDVVEELEWTSEHAGNRRHDRVRDSLQRAAKLIS